MTDATLPPQAAGIAGGESLRRRRRAAVPDCVAPLHDLVLASARSSTVEDVDGRRYLDLTSGLGVMLLGYGHPEIEAALLEQARRLVHSSFPTCPTEPYIELAARLAECAGEGNGRRYKVFLVNSGAEAVENAVKIARWATGRSSFLALEGAFHGRTLAASALTFKAHPYKQGLGPLGFEVHHLPLEIARPRPTAAPAEGPDEERVATIGRALERLATESFDPGTVAGLFVEPVLGEGGCVPLAREFLVAAARFCRRHGILLIADEIQCGAARTGPWFVTVGAGVEPDLLLAGKAIGGGLPLAAVIGRAEVLDSLHRGALGGTMGGNPVACAAGARVIDVVRREELGRRAAWIGERARAALADLQDNGGAPFSIELRVAGAMVGLALRPRAEGAPAPADVVAAVLRRARERGVLLLRGGLAGDTVRMLPALTIGEDELETGLVLAAACLKEALEHPAVRVGEQGRGAAAPGRRE